SLRSIKSGGCAKSSKRWVGSSCRFRLSTRGWSPGAVGAPNLGTAEGGMSDGREYLEVGADAPYYAYQQKLKSEKISYYESWIGEEELTLIAEVIRDNWISEGPKTREFER